ncbi:MAG: ribbon-helix-helix protein, CopG family [Devosia sp.]|nr:ribbon-helix-helix protein, CopG family [Devosia sp.]
MVRVQPDLMDALDRFIREEHPDTSRPEALRIAFRDWAIGHGYLPPSPDAED